jgi:glycerate 2-kinase
MAEPSELEYCGSQLLAEAEACISTILLCELFHKPETLTAPDPLRLRRILEDLYSAATRAVAPGPALRLRLEGLHLLASQRVWILALGKAAAPMAETAVSLLQERGISQAGGLIVGPAPSPPPSPNLICVQGDHPEPGPGSLAAADALANITGQVRESDEVWVLLSGGTTSLIGAPEPGITPPELASIYALLLGSGLDITAMNRIRKRFSRWGGGKLARALAPARVRVFVISDVIGDDLASIGSGPCVPDPTTAAEVHSLLEATRLWDRFPDQARRLVLSAESGHLPETPKPGDQTFARVTHELIASNRLALDAAAGRARELNLTPFVHDTPLSGEAARVGTELAAALLDDCARQVDPQSGSPAPCWIWGGETTVSLGGNTGGMGGRCQELALAAAKLLSGSPTGAALLAAGTDGRDGPTDAAGAVVDSKTWGAVRASGRDPELDLKTHNAYAALDAAGALLRPGLTGTNVMDVVIGLCVR